MAWYSYGSRAAAEEACKAEGCDRLGTKEEQIEYGSLCTVLWSSQTKGYFMIGKHAGCGQDGWNNGGWRATAGAFCAGCPDCPTTEEEDDQEEAQEVDEGPKCTVLKQYNTKQAPVSNCKSGQFPVGSQFCLNGKVFHVSASWNTGRNGATVNIADGEKFPKNLFKEGDEITPRCEDHDHDHHEDHEDHEDHDNDHSTIPHKGRTPVTIPPLEKSSYRIAVTLPVSLQSMTAEAKKELKIGAENAFHCGTGVYCAAELQEGAGVSLLESRKSFTIIIVIVILGVPDEVAALPDPATESDSLQSQVFASLLVTATDPALHAALLSASVDEVTPDAGHSWIQGMNAENAPFSCLRSDGQGYADHLYAEHSDGHGDVWYGDLSEAKKRCDADDECVVLHDWAGDGKAWRSCRSVTFKAGGPAHTLVRS